MRVPSRNARIDVWFISLLLRASSASPSATSSNRGTAGGVAKTTVAILAQTSFSFKEVPVETKWDCLLQREFKSRHKQNETGT